MADIGQVLATGGMTIAAVAVGAGLTYWFGALNRRHQEARENETRWYEPRRQAYAEFDMAVTNYLLQRDLTSKRAVTGTEEFARAGSALMASRGRIYIVGSQEAITLAERVAQMAADSKTSDATFRTVLREFRLAARKDLGHPEVAPMAKASHLRQQLGPGRPLVVR